MFMTPRLWYHWKAEIFSFLHVSSDDDNASDINEDNDDNNKDDEDHHQYNDNYNNVGDKEEDDDNDGLLVPVVPSHLVIPLILQWRTRPVQHQSPGGSLPRCP